MNGFCRNQNKNNNLQIRINCSSLPDSEEGSDSGSLAGDLLCPSGATNRIERENRILIYNSPNQH